MRAHRQTGLLLATLAAIASSEARANSVLVEGNCAGVPATIPAGACGDYDGDGRVGAAEDGDGDAVFGTLDAANGPDGINDNGTILIVTSGVFAEAITITGNVTLEAAQGVIANLDAVLPGDDASVARQGQIGILVDAPDNRYVVLRNLAIRNWRIGIRATGETRVAIERCVLEHNVEFGIEADDDARVKIDRSEVLATGFRFNPATGDFPGTNLPLSPIETDDPLFGVEVDGIERGTGIVFRDRSRGAVFRTEVSGSDGAGIAIRTRAPVLLEDVFVFDNDGDLDDAFDDGATPGTGSPLPGRPRG